MKVIVFAIVGLVLGLGGGSGVAIMKAKKTMAAAADSVAKKDSATALAKAAHEGGRTDGRAGVEPMPSVATPATDSGGEHAAPVTRDSVAAPNAGHGSASAGPVLATLPAPPGPASAKAPAGDSAPTAAPVPGRIAKIFAAMSAKDAAKVLLQLDDADIQTVLSGLNDKQAAAILAGFPPERAAAISRAAIRGKKGAS